MNSSSYCIVCCVLTKFDTKIDVTCELINLLMFPQELNSKCYDKAVRVVFGNIKLNKPPPASRTATMNVGAGQYESKSVAITTLPIMPPRRAATIDIATPVALKAN